MTEISLNTVPFWIYTVTRVPSLATSGAMKSKSTIAAMFSVDHNLPVAVV